MADKEPKAWITVNGRRVPIFEGESKEDAIKKIINKPEDEPKKEHDKASKDEETKEKQIARNKAEADKLNGKGKSVTERSSELISYLNDLDLGKMEVSKRVDALTKWLNNTDFNDLSKEEQIAFLQNIAKRKDDGGELRVPGNFMAVDAKRRMLQKDFKGTYKEYLDADKAKEEKSNREYAERKAKQQAEKEAKERARKEQLEHELQTQPKHKVDQYKLIQKYNPMFDDVHVGIRKPSDIKTWEEAIKDDESFTWGDFSRDDAEKALKKGRITIYSSYPIKQGVFVSTSRIQAEEYAGGPGNRVYSKTIPLDSVAWINGDEGQFASVNAYQKRNL